MLRWSDAANQQLDVLVRDVEPAYRETAKRHTREETERYCADARVKIVGPDQVVIGHIKATPIDRRQALKQSLRFKGVIVEKFDMFFQNLA